MLEIKDFSAGWGKNKYVLRHLNCTIKENLIYALIGPNASGKTTLLRSIIKDVPFSSGEILISGKSITEMSAAETAGNVSFSPSEVPVNFDFRTEEFVGMGRFAARGSFWADEEDEAAVRHGMEAMDVYEIRRRRLNDISTGQKQRCLLAQIIVKDTPVILMDEPTAHLDIKHRADFVRRLLSLREAGNKTLVITFHDLNDAVNVADRLILLKNGEITGIIPSEKLTSEDLSSLYETKIVLSENTEGIKTVSAYFK